jgi:hypothetical protein
LDFKTLESYELRRRVEPVIQALESVRPDFTQSDRYVDEQHGRMYD